MSVVTAPAVPLPTDFTAAACALEAFEPVTGFSAPSWAAVPWSGKPPRSWAEEVEELLLGVGVPVAALADSEPARTPPATAPAARSPAAHAQRTVRLCRWLESFIVPPLSWWPPRWRPVGDDARPTCQQLRRHLCRG